MRDEAYINMVYRRYVFYAAIFLACVVLIAGFFNLQVLQAHIYREKSLKNSVKVVTQNPVRGNIYDRDGRLIVDSRPGFSLYLIPAQTPHKTIRWISKVLGLNQKEIEERLRRAGRFQPVKIARYVDLITLTRVQENILDLNGLEWKVEPRRNYVYSRSFAHVIGTLGEIDEGDMRNNPDFEPGDVIGKKGIEKAMDSYLRGRKGFKYVRVDAFGRTVEEVASKQSKLPLPGDDIYLTIDARLQQFADSLLGKWSGALVAIEVQTGEIITLVSRPDYDLKWFAETVNPQIWQSLITDSLHPLYARAYQSAYPPGSTFKLVAAVAALNEGIITPQWTAYCPGYYRIGRRTVKCWYQKGHGTLDLLGAIKNSCNVYFYQLGLKIGIDFWSEYSRLFHFGHRTGIELTNENPGLIPSRDYYDRVYGKGNWTKGMLANLAIGQGEVLVTPLQMAQFTMMLANRGFYYPPHLTRKLVDRVNHQERVFTFEKRKVANVKPEVYDVILQGMQEVVNGGTGWRANIIGISVSGKTGTSQNPQGKDHAWFIGFAPSQNPEIAVVVLIEHGGSGGGRAAPLAGQFIRRYFYYRGEFDYREEQRILRAIMAKRKEQARRDSLQNSIGFEN